MRLLKQTLVNIKPKHQELQLRAVHNNTVYCWDLEEQEYKVVKCIDASVLRACEEEELTMITNGENTTLDPNARKEPIRSIVIRKNSLQAYAKAVKVKELPHYKTVTKTSGLFGLHKEEESVYENSTFAYSVESLLGLRYYPWQKEEEDILLPHLRAELNKIPESEELEWPDIFDRFFRASESWIDYNQWLENRCVEINKKVVRCVISSDTATSVIGAFVEQQVEADKLSKMLKSVAGLSCDVKPLSGVGYTLPQGVTLESLAQQVDESIDSKSV